MQQTAKPKREKKLCNCAGCGKVLVGFQSAKQKAKGEEVVFIRIDDRPYCQACRGGGYVDDEV